MATELRVRTLDACLARLEEAHVQGETSVSEALFKCVSPHVPGIQPGMRIRSALDATFKEQEKVLAGRVTSVALAAQRSATGELTEEEARTLTRRIREE